MHFAHPVFWFGYVPILTGRPRGIAAAAKSRVWLAFGEKRSDRGVGNACAGSLLVQSQRASGRGGFARCGLDPERRGRCRREIVAVRALHRPSVSADGHGVIESLIRAAPRIQKAMEERYATKLRGAATGSSSTAIFRSPDRSRPEAGFYEVLKHAAALALEHGLLRLTDDYALLDSEQARTFFSRHRIAVRLDRQSRPLHRHHGRSDGVPGRSPHVVGYAAMEEGRTEIARRYGRRARFRLQRGRRRGPQASRLWPKLPFTLPAKM